MRTGSAHTEVAAARPPGKVTRLYVILPDLEPALVHRPSVCPHCGCESEHLERHQRVVKPVQDAENHAMPTSRYRCLKCGRTFRSYPQGVGRAALSKRLKNLAVLLYLLGLSYQSVATALEALGLYISKTSVYGAVQAAVKRAPGCQRQSVFSQVQVSGPGSDGTSVWCGGRWLPLRLVADDATGLILVVDGLPADLSESLKDWSESLPGAIGVRLFFVGEDGAS